MKSIELFHCRVIQIKLISTQDAVGRYPYTTVNDLCGGSYCMILCCRWSYTLGIFGDLRAAQVWSIISWPGERLCIALFYIVVLFPLCEISLLSADVERQQLGSTSHLQFSEMTNIRHTVRLHVRNLSLIPELHQIFFPWKSLLVKKAYNLAHF